MRIQIRLEDAVDRHGPRHRGDAYRTLPGLQRVGKRDEKAQHLPRLRGSGPDAAGDKFTIRSVHPDDSLHPARPTTRPRPTAASLQPSPARWRVSKTATQRYGQLLQRIGSATASVTGGPYAITAVLNNPDSKLGNYTVTYNTGSLTVTPAPLTLTPDAQTKTYGSEFTAFTGTVAGIQNGDDITASYSSLGSAATASVAGGPYAITALLNDPDSKLGNYTVSYNTGSLTVTPAPLTVTPDNQTKTYGSEFTAFTGTLAGLQNGDDITASYSSLGSAATASVSGGPYKIRLSLTTRTAS